MPKKAMVLIAVAAAVLYAGLWAGVSAGWTWLTSADIWVLQQFHNYGSSHPSWVSGWGLVSDLLSPTVLRIAGALCIVVALVQRQMRIAGFLAIAVIPAGLATAAAKALSDRPRPETALTYAASSSFPSGHALGITVGVLAFGTLLWPWVRPWMRVPVIAVGVALVLLVGLSRVVLNVHHPTDVIAGWVLGLLYYLLCMQLVPPRDPRASVL